MRTLWPHAHKQGVSAARQERHQHQRDEGDYDGEALGVDYAVEIAEKAGLFALVYTSPSHAPLAPRWRVLCPTSREHPPAARMHLLARLNGLYRGVFSSESWTLSQAYFFGSVNRSPEHRVELVEGEAIDELDELDHIAIGAPEPRRRRAADGSAVSGDASG